MPRSYITLAIAAQLFAGAALAQSATDTTATFGADWSTSLGTALFSDDGTTVRSASEIETQWSTLSEDDRSMLRRDCGVHMQAPVDGAAGTDTGTDATGTDTTGTDTTGTDATGTDATGTDATGTTTMDSTTGTLSVSAAQMDEICAAINDL